MTTNGDIPAESADAEMVEAEDDEGQVVTMLDVLEEQQELEDDANAVLGGSDEKECTYSQGYIKRQAIYACLSCCPESKEDPTKRAGFCLACSLTCHEDHDVVELYTKRNFRCDCGNPKFKSSCQFTPHKPDLNEGNKYNQNFIGLYCICSKPYNRSSALEGNMIQCLICEDWLHTAHLDALVPGNEQYTEMICKLCMTKNEFIHDYGEFAFKTESGDVDIIDGDGDDSSITVDSFTNGNSDEILTNGSVTEEILTNGIREESTETSTMDDVAVSNRNDDSSSPQEESTEPEKDDSEKAVDEESINKPTNAPMEIDETELLPEVGSYNPEITFIDKTENIETSEEKYGLNCTSEESGSTSDVKSEGPSTTSQQKPDEPNTSELKSDESTTSEKDSDEPNTSKLKSNEPTTFEKNSEEPTTPEKEFDEPTTSEKESDEPTTSEQKSDEPGPTFKEKSADKLKPVETTGSSKPSEDVQSATNDETSLLNIEKQCETPKENDSHTADSETAAENSDVTENSEQGSNYTKITEDEPATIVEKSQDDISSSEETNFNSKDEIPTDEKKATSPVQEINESNAASLDEEMIESKHSENAPVDNVDHNTNVEKSAENQNDSETESVTPETTVPELGSTENKRKMSIEGMDDTENDTAAKKPKIDKCNRPKDVKKVQKGATFWPATFREKLCKCNECITMYKDLDVLFLTDPEDTIIAYQILGKERTAGKPNQYEKAVEALCSLGRIQQIDALTEYNKMRDKLLTYLQSFKDRQLVVTEQDIKSFFTGIKLEKRNDGVYFCG